MKLVFQGNSYFPVYLQRLTRRLQTRKMKHHQHWYKFANFTLFLFSVACFGHLLLFCAHPSHPDCYRSPKWDMQYGNKVIYSSTLSFSAVPFTFTGQKLRTK